MYAFDYQKDTFGIVTITMDMPGPANMMSQEFIRLFGDVIRRLEKEEGLHGVLLSSAKSTFFSGEDLTRLIQLKPGQEADIFKELEELKELMRRLETLPVPSVAAINGGALGAGFELCLCCNYRIAWSNPSVKIGLPEVGLGLHPSVGGIVRLTHLLGVQRALPILTEGKQISPAQALNEGLIHELVTKREELIPRAKAWLRSVKDNVDAFIQPWDQTGHRIPGGSANSPKIAPTIGTVCASLFHKTKGHLPASEHILDVIMESARVDFDTALRIESRSFAQLVTTATAKNMMTAFFFDLNLVNGGQNRPSKPPQSLRKRVGIIGAGLIGQGIAYVTARSGIETVLVDVNQQTAERGKAYCAKQLDRRLQKGRMSQQTRDKVLDSITPSNRFEDLADCDLVIEAVYEDVEVKNNILRQVEPLLSAQTLWASCTSTYTIANLSANSQRPENFIGLHFFLPADKVPLVEITVSEETSDTTLAQAFDFIRQIKKTPIVIRDKAGRFAARTQRTYLMEGIQLLHEGIHPARIDGIARHLGYPMGPLALHDELGFTETLNTLEHLPEDPTPDASALLNTMVHELKRTGKIAAKGFYEYSDFGKQLWPGLSRWQQPTDISNQDIEDRLLFRPVLESMFCLEEGVLRSVSDGNIGSIMGIACPPWTGGYLQFVNTYGLERFIRRCETLSTTFGSRFDVPRIARIKAEENTSFSDSSYTE